MAIQTKVQQLILSLERGQLGLIIRIAAVTTLIISLTLLYLFVQFIGLGDPAAMDQAQIARNIASGQGFTTDMITPRALATLKDSGKLPSSGTPIDLKAFPDLYNMPLVPFLNALPLSLIKNNWKMSSTDLIYLGDRLLAFFSIVFMLLALAIWFFVFMRLFDSKIALLACCGVLLTDLIWQLSLSALPQMVVMLFFGLASLFTVIAEEEQAMGNTIKTIIFLAATGLCFGLMILAHGLSTWIFFGWALYAGIVFQPRGLIFLVTIGTGLLVVAPWLVRNLLECGNPFGLAITGILDPRDPYTEFLRINQPETPQSIVAALRTGLTNQLGSLPSYIGLNIAAAMFFTAIFHPFRNPSTSLFRWALLSMWAFALVGMCFFEPTKPVSANQLHAVFIPPFVCYGLAFLLVLWGRWEITLPFLRTIFISFILFLCAIPLIAQLLGGQNRRIQWPPYVPPFISVISNWFEENEVIASDMPWAVAWYGQRTSLLLPQTVREFNELHDYRQFAQQIQGLYITPVSGNRQLFSEIYKGPFAEWAALITRPPRTQGFPLTSLVTLPIDGECVLFADRERWAKPSKEDEE